jgi:hypothetical protein
MNPIIYNLAPAVKKKTLNDLNRKQRSLMGVNSGFKGKKDD